MRKICARVIGSVIIGVLLFACPGFAASRQVDNPVVDIVKNFSSAVVNIDVEAMQRRSASPMPFNDPRFRHFFGDDIKEFSRSVPMKGRGSGFVVSKDGQILTNNHVVAGAEKITVTLSDGKTYPAEVLGKDPTFDLAVIKIKPDNDLAVLRLGDSDTIDVGEWVVAIGNPYGLEHTVTVGVISAKNRSIHARDVNFDGFLQTDAAINPGNSGGPLIDMDGKVVGINTAILPYAQGLGFAIPVNMAKQIMNDLVSYGKVKRGWLGISVQNLSKEFAEAYGVKEESGVIVGDVFKDSAAERAGLQRGDVITEVGGEKVKDIQWFVNKIRSLTPDDSVKLKVVRSGNSLDLTAKLAERPDTEDGDSPSQENPNAFEKVGLTVAKLTPDIARRYKIENRDGVVVVGVAQGSPAQFAGVREGDLLLEANGKKLTGSSALGQIIKSDSKSVVFLIERDGKTFFTSINIE
ncbi:protease [Synergistales bacterium]|nr:protease [Synergistales bacterium]